VQLAVVVLKAATRWASRTELLSRDPLLGFDRPAAKSSQAATGAWTADEARGFLRTVEGDLLEAAWWLLLARGLRRGELCGLRWANVDFAAGRLRIVETRVVIKAKAVKSEPKTDAGRRSVPIDEHLAGLAATSGAPREGADTAGQAWANTDYVFTDQLGEPYRPDYLSSLFSRLAAAAAYVGFVCTTRDTLRRH
jgi:integrase